MIPYLLDVSLCWLIFYLLYYFWLSKETFFELNRWYLLSTLLLGLIIPLIPSPFGTEVQESEWVTLYVAPITMGLESLQVTVTAPGEVEQHFNWLLLLKWIYWGGVGFTAVRFFSGLWRIGSLYWGAEHLRVGQYQVALTNEAHLPFSFFRVVFKSKEGNLDEFAEEKITDHELAHVRGWHTIDVLLVELVSIFLWCSPPVHLYRRSLRIVHEYIADSVAIRSGQKKQYGYLLIRQSQSGLELALANHFIQSQLKKRIMMMTKTRSRRQAFLKYLPVIPLLVVALVIFSNWEAVANDPLNLLGKEVLKNIEVMDPVAVGDYDPLVLKKLLTAVLHKRQQLTTNQDAQLARKFAAIHDEWIEKYPEHQQEIRKITKAVAGQYKFSLEFADHKIKTGFFKEPFKVHTPDTKPSSDLDFNSDELRIRGVNENPYVLINDKPAPENWKAEIVPDMIESINVLKGEAAIKEYGEKAKDGAISIYTKGFKKAETTMPRFPGCENIADPDKRSKCAEVNLMEYVFSNLKYPESAKKQNVEGLVVASYVVDKTGEIKDIQILKSIGAGTDEVVKEVLRNMPRQIPGTLDGVPAEVEMKLPIKFKATEEGIKEREDLPDPKVVISKLKNGKTDPLFVLDGEILESGQISELDPDDIERIDVLKGEQAIAVYGEKGGDGVVRIYTKTRPYDVSPIFPGCEELEGEEQEKCSQKAFLMSIYKNITYPAAAREKNIQGTILVKYTIGKTGKVQNAQIYKGIDEALDAEVLRVINEVPDWQAARKDGKPVAVDLVLPVNFRLESDVELSKEARDALQKEKLQEKTKANQISDKSQIVDEIVVVGYGSNSKQRKAFRMVEEMPRFPGCEEEADEQVRSNCAMKHMLQFVYNNVKYPKAAKNAGIEGMVVVSFVVAKDGRIKDARIEKGLGYGLNEQVLEVINEMPAWIPGKQDGKIVEVVYNLPVRFKLDSKVIKKEKKKPTTVHVTGPVPQPVVSGKNSLELRNFKATPNPSNGLINLLFQGEAQPLTVSILSANGQLVYQREFPRFGGNFDEQINLQEAPKGTLFIRVQQEGRVHSSTIVLQ